MNSGMLPIILLLGLSAWTETPAVAPAQHTKPIRNATESS